MSTGWAIFATGAKAMAAGQLKRTSLRRLMKEEAARQVRRTPLALRLTPTPEAIGGDLRLSPPFVSISGGLHARARGAHYPRGGLIPTAGSASQGHPSS